jgi:hypothetical protein
LNSSSFTQVINYILTYLFFKVTLYLLYRSHADANSILSQIFSYNSWLQVFAIVLFLIGYYYGSFLENLIFFFNNSENFAVGAISTVFPRARLFGFSPEPSFWSFFVAINIAIGLTTEKPNKFYFFINLLSLISTFGRTGFLIAGCIFLLKFLKGNALQKALGILILFIGFFKLGKYLDFNMLTSVDVSFKQRLESLLVAVDLASNNFFFGIGIGNFKVYAQQNNYEFLDIFNFFLNTLVATGIFGLLSFSFCLWFIFKRIHPHFNLAFYGAIVGWMTVSSYNLPYLWILFGVLVYASYQKQVSDDISQTI